MPTLQQMRQEVRGFLGVNLRRDRLTLADADLARAINADLMTTTGAIVLRHGRARQSAVLGPMAGPLIRRLGRVNAVRYRIVGTQVFRENRLISDDLADVGTSAIIPFQPLNDSVTWAFIADQGKMLKDLGPSALLQNWGLVGPTTAPGAIAGAGGLTGQYRAVYTYVRRARGSTTAVGHESNPSPASAAVTLTGQGLSLSGLTASTDPQVGFKRIYRTLAGGTLHLYDQEIANATTTALSTVADTALGALVETDNDPPVLCGWGVEWKEHVWLCRDRATPHRLWYSKRFRPESVPLDNFLDIGTPDDPLQVAQPMAGALGVFTPRTKYRVTGSVVSGFTHDAAISQRGTPAPAACIATERGIFFTALDGAFLTSLIGPDVELSGAIAPLWYGEAVNGYEPINWAAATAMSAAYYRGRFYLGLPLGTDTQASVVAVFAPVTGAWYFFDWTPTTLFVESETNLLAAGWPDRRVYVLELGFTDAGAPIALDVETKDFLGESGDLRKLFQWVRIDADTLGAALTVELYVDGRLKRTFSFTSARTRPLLPFPEGSLGYTWRVRFRYTGDRRLAIYAVEALWMPLEMA